MIRLCLAAAQAVVAASLCMQAVADDSGIDFADVYAKGLEAWSEPEGSTMTPEEVERAATYVLGSATFILYHEFGHAMVSEFQLSVLGKPEDAVDSFATLYMIADEEDDTLDNMIAEAANAWFDQQTNNESNDRLYDYGPHSVESQRGYQILCLLVGSDPEGWKEAADEAGLPEDRQKNCPYEYERTVAAWDDMMGHNELAEDEAPTGNVNVVWDKAEDKFAMIANVLYYSGIGEAIAAQISSTFRLNGDITLQFTNCGTPNAWWIENERTVRFCYDWADHWRTNIAYYTNQDKAEAMPTEPDAADAETTEAE